MDLGSRRKNSIECLELKKPHNNCQKNDEQNTGVTTMTCFQKSITTGPHHFPYFN